jgi:hypothetical protein
VNVWSDTERINRNVYNLLISKQFFRDSEWWVCRQFNYGEGDTKRHKGNIADVDILTYAGSTDFTGIAYAGIAPLIQVVQSVQIVHICSPLFRRTTQSFLFSFSLYYSMFLNRESNWIELQRMLTQLRDVTHDVIIMAAFTGNRGIERPAAHIRSPADAKLHLDCLDSRLLQHPISKYHDTAGRRWTNWAQGLPATRRADYYP